MGVAERRWRSTKQNRLSSLFEFPGACSNYQEPAATAAAAAPAPSQILPLSFTPPRRGKFHHFPPHYDASISSRRSNLPQRSYSFPVISSSSMYLGPNSPALDRNIFRQQQEQEQGEIVEVRDAFQTRRSTSLRELFRAERLHFSPTDDDFLSAKADFSSDVNKSSPISDTALTTRSSSSSHSTLQELLNSETEKSPRFRFKHRGSRKRSWKLSVQSFRAKYKQKQAQEDANSEKQDSPKLKKPLSSKADDKLEKQQMPNLQKSSSQARKSAPISRDSGWGKLEVKGASTKPVPPPQLMDSFSSFARSGSTRSTLARQVSTSSTHEQYYISRRTAGVRLRKRTFMPYRQQLISFFCCVPDKSHVIH
ncbi:hypothetical protein O6H91_07G050500 [Diphasiastrum complanatum]|uniref:Uncharacterized protein n=1 Tax=Diphasiastrum complanatum TaxID=34168 RepID=A0ACC2D502_DIPCM|nr:hypothetical protein O6H91_07G050500 [Diphasiastrum complanatum]